MILSMRTFTRFGLLCVLLFGFIQVGCTKKDSSTSGVVEKSRDIHERVLTLDTHVDFDPRYFTKKLHQGMSLDAQVDLPQMKQGGLDAAFYIVYTPQRDLNAKGYESAYKQAMEMFDAVHRMTSELNSDQIELALTADDVERIYKLGKRVALIGVENPYPIGTDLSRVKLFYDRGARYVSLAHNGHSQFADSNTNKDEGPLELYGGLSAQGRKLIAELNRLGIMVDVSHASKKSMMQAIELSKAPVIASHSSVRALRDHSRNLDDEQLKALAKNGGVVQIVAFRDYLVQVPEGWEQFGKQLDLRYGLKPEADWNNWWSGLDDDTKDRYRKERNEARREHVKVGVPRFVDHIDYAVKLIGVDHVGISSDFGGGGGIDGWDSAKETLNITKLLVERGYSEADIAKIWSGNLLRVMREVQSRAAKPAES